MFTCILCLSQSRESRSVGLDQEVVPAMTVADAIRTHFKCYHHMIIKGNGDPELVCTSCFTLFKSFYDFLSLVNLNYNVGSLIIKQEPQEEVIAMDFIQIDHLAQKEDEQTELKLEHEKTDENKPSSPITVKDESKKTENEDSDFEWELEDNSEWMDSAMTYEDDTVGETKKTEEVPEAPKRKPSYWKRGLDDSDYEPFKKKTYLKYLPKSEITPELLASGKTHVEIDGVNYRVPRLKRREPKPKPVSTRAIDPTRRPHRAYDPEGEQKIRDFCEVKCNICDIKFEAFWRVRKHFKQFHPDQKGYLMCCNRKFTRRYALLEHIEFHDKSKIWSCLECKKEFISRKTRDMHIKTIHLKITKKETVMCNYCGALVGVLNLKRHLLTHTIENDDRIWECYICKKSQFKHDLALLHHIRYRHNAKKSREPIICHICSTVLKCQSSFKNHMRTQHSDEAKNRERTKCKFCDHWLLTSSMRAHLRQHKEAGVSCDLCGKYLKSKSSLQSHMKTVHGEKKYKCEFCEKLFFREKKMIEHVAVKHTRDFPFQCRVCDRQFRSEANCYQHQRKYHREEYDKHFKPHYLRGPDDPFFAQNESSNSMNDENKSFLLL